MTRGLRCLLSVIACLLATAFLGACSHDLGDPYAWLTPGAQPSPFPGASVWVVGLPDVVLGSPDGGATWKVNHRSANVDPLTGDLWAVAFGDADHGWAVRRGLASPPESILVTADAGVSWSWQHPNVQGRLLSVAAVDARHAWVVGYDKDEGLALATGNGGTTWRQQRVPADLQLSDVAFGDTRHGWILGHDAVDLARSVVLATSDGGAHWRVVFSSRRAHLQGLAALGPLYCWAVGAVDKPQSGFVALTRDGGAHWQTQQDVTDEPLGAVSFPDARHGWAVGPAGTSAATDDGGDTWSKQSIDSRFDLKAVTFADAQHGWALIGHLALLATADGGATWGVVRPANTRDALTGLTSVAGRAAAQR